MKKTKDIKNMTITEIGEFFKQKRLATIENGVPLSQRKAVKLIAEKTGEKISFPQLRWIENGGNFTMKFLIALCKFYDVEINIY